MVNLNEVDWSQLPRPEDDGAAAHLTGIALKHLPLPATNGSQVDLASLQGQVVLYIYPMTGRPDVPLPDGWDGIPGARGCTPQSCAFRDHYADLKALGVDHLFGLSTQTTEYQVEAAERMHLPFPLLSDADLTFANALELPTFEVEGMTLLKRMALILRDGEIIKTFYPVFPPDRNADDVMEWLKAQSGR
ncbi:redoxin family protein [Rhodobacteraceae bacterium IMCC1335]